MDDCISSLAESPEHHGDQILAAIAQIRKFVEDVAQVTVSLQDIAHVCRVADLDSLLVETSRA